MRTGIRVVLTVAFGLFSLPPLIFGVYLLACSLRIHTMNVYYVEYPYLASAVAFIALGAVILFCAVYGAWRRSFYGLVFGIAVVFGLATMEK